MKYPCGYIMVEYERPQEPNNYGRDVFRWYVTSHPSKGFVLYPSGGIEDNTPPVRQRQRQRLLLL